MTDAFSRITWPVRTARLSLRPAEVSDLDAVWAYRRLPEVLAVESPYAQGEVRDQAANTQAELGWCIAPDHAGREPLHRSGEWMDSFIYALLREEWQRR